MGPETGPRIKVADRGPAQEPAPRPPDTLRGALLAAGRFVRLQRGFPYTGPEKRAARAARGGGLSEERGDDQGPKDGQRRSPREPVSSRRCRSARRPNPT